MSIPVITVDGPSATGKGTLSKMLATKLNWHYLDSGAIYRVLALAALIDKISPTDTKKLVEIALNLNVNFLNLKDKSYKILLRGQDVTMKIRSEECGVFASKIAALQEVRAALKVFQQSFRKPPGLIADGRDMGTVIFPDATAKFFLTATIEERAKRRLLQLQQGHINASLGTVLRDLIERDSRDEKRSISPLEPAKDAIIIDTTKLSIEEVLQTMLAHIAKQGGY